MSETVIADDMFIKGEVTTTGDVELKGVIEGDITCGTLLVQQDAKIKGSATAEKVVVRGSIEGRINGVRVTLTSSAKVQGELICKALAVDEEAYFDGTSQSVEDPLDDGKSAAAAAGLSEMPKSKPTNVQNESSKSEKDVSTQVHSVMPNRDN